jgi:hypothetical protein
MIFPDGSKRAGFFENNVFHLPLQSRNQLKKLEDEMPSELLEKLLEYI